MNTYQRELLDKLIAELTDKPSPNLHAAQMLAAELKGAMQAQAEDDMHSITCDCAECVPQSTPSENAIPRDQPWHLYPNGTKAPAHGGGHWTRVTGGWKWCTGDIFPSPGGDNMDRVILPQPTPDDGWVENTGVDPECVILACKMASGHILNEKMYSGSMNWKLGIGLGTITHYKPE